MKRNTNGFICLATLLIALLITGTVRADRPNVLFICVDDMNDWVGCLDGYEGSVHTPNIDRLAKRGRLFTNAHCDAPVCNASRTSVMLGLRPSTTGVYDNGRWWRPALKNAVSMPMHFRAADYQTEGGGKIFHHTPGFNPPDQWDAYFNQVFDDQFHRPGPKDTAPVPGVRWPKGYPLSGIEAVRLNQKPPANAREFDWGPFDSDDSDMGDGQMTSWAEKFLVRKHDKPYFLAAGIFRPHLPWYAPKKYFEMYPEASIVLPTVKPNDLDDVPEQGKKIAGARTADFELIKKAGQYRRSVQAYLASITFADALVGRLLEALDASGKANNTIIVLWSDHGWHLGEKDAWHKRTLWDESTRVPLIIAGPGVNKPFTSCDEPVNLVDLYPTLIEMCGLDEKPELDGLSLVPQLKDAGASRDRPALTTHMPKVHAIRTRHYRYIRYTDGSEELYDHRDDPNEWVNQAGRPEYAAVVKDLARWIPTDDAPVAPTKSRYKFDPATYTWTPLPAKKK